jgi:hypothetical protein
MGRRGWGMSDKCIICGCPVESCGNMCEMCMMDMEGTEESEVDENE